MIGLGLSIVQLAVLQRSSDAPPPPPVSPHILLEDGSALLLEDGSLILLEA